ncbi:MAG TPA: GspE/PulE family protein [bacterium]|nr:GspE/PulE family protein [bacterium]HPO11191.1 GspE/PulE family protein [bacterium]HQL11394.1 GspE/PulE family protein [bacterium]
MEDKKQENQKNEEEKKEAPKIDIATQSVKDKFNEVYKKIQVKEEEAATEATANLYGLDYIDLHKFPIGPEALQSIPEQDCHKYGIVCFFRGFQEMRIGITTFNDNVIEYINAIDTEEADTKKKIYLISQGSLDVALALYEKLPKIKPFEYGMKIDPDIFDKFKNELKTFEDVNRKMQEVDLPDMITLIFAAAIEFDASDIHIEAAENRVIVRLRIEGMLQEIASIKKEIWPKLITRIKLLAKLKMNVSDIPQDGRITIVLNNDKVDVRVSTLPTAYGESVVMRLLKSSVQGLAFENLGLIGSTYDRLEKAVDKPIGMIITTGPTGSGKTTTLYAILNKLNKPNVNVVTLEDPIEYKLPGLNQSQIDYSRNYDFARGLRSILRQDPNVIMVGEIRDGETAEVAVEAALTGHKVLSTIHANSAPAAIPRFLVMGVKPFLLAPALNVVMAQRLVRRICTNCKEEIKLDPKVQENVEKILLSIPEASGFKVDINNLHFYHGRGCDKCHGIGYKGRIGLYEIMDMNEEIEKIILSGNVSEYELEKIAINHGMLKVVQDGLLKATQGITTVEEVFRVASQ